MKLREKNSPFIIPVVQCKPVMYERDFWQEYESRPKVHQVDWLRMVDDSENELWKSLILTHKNRNKSRRLDNGAKSRRSEWRSNWFLYFWLFCRESSLHGLHFLAESKKRSVLERIMWFLTLCVVYGTCGFLISNSFQLWLSSPVFMSMENKPMSIAFTPFPAITICDTNQVDATKFKLSDYISNREYLKSNINNTYLHQVDYVNILCQNSHLDPDFHTDYLNLAIFHQMMNAVHQTCQDVVATIKWTNETLENPCGFMQPVLTEYGICHSFNMMPFKVILRGFYYEVVNKYRSSGNWSSLSYSDWYPETGYQGKPISVNDIPRRLSGTGNLYSFAVQLNANSDSYNRHCNSGSEGYAVLVHSPADMPVSVHAKIVSTATSQYSISVQPKITRTANTIKSWSPLERGCYYDAERRLHYFKLYTQSNCHLECESNYSFSECGCVAFYQPRTLFTPICGSVKMDCVEDALVRFAEMVTGDQPPCNCLPGCTTLQYDTSATSMIRNDPVKINESNVDELNESEENEKSQNVVCTFSVSFENREMLGIIRRGLFSFSDFLGNIGGILGLFLGFSFVSLVEIVYFLAFKPVMKNRNQSVDDVA